MPDDLFAKQRGDSLYRASSWMRSSRIVIERLTANAQVYQHGFQHPPTRLRRSES
jgi:hypothetical protein